MISNGSGSISLCCYRFEQQSLTDNSKVENVIVVVKIPKSKNHSLAQMSLEIDLNSMFSHFGLLSHNSSATYKCVNNSSTLEICF